VLATYPELNEAWHAFLRRGIRKGKVQKGQEPVPEDDPLLNRNYYIAQLVQGKSLLRDMREAGVRYQLAALYEMEVRGMEQQRMQKLLDVGEKLADFERQQGDLRIVHDLERSETSSEMRAVLRQAARRHAEVSGTPLMTRWTLLSGSCRTARAGMKRAISSSCISMRSWPICSGRKRLQGRTNRRRTTWQ